MRHSAKYPIALAVFLCGLWAGCAGSVTTSQDPSAFRGQIERLQRRLLANPQDTEALRDLGIIYLRTNQFGLATENLQNAYARDADDPSTLFHLGLLSELTGQQDTALRFFATYPEISRLSPYRRMMQGRYEWLVRIIARNEIQQRLAQEAQTGGGQTSPRIVAVFPFDYLGEDEQYAALGRGLGEMVTVDLANIESLSVVERVRLQALLDELSLAETGVVDNATAPRAGRLLGAGRVVGGSYDVLPGSNLRMDAAVMVLAEEPAFPPEADTQSGALNQLFTLEKQLVFDLIEEMEIQLTPEERQEIESVPTQNLQAFLAFSRGLQSEDEGDFSGAADLFQQAGQLDPGFEMASQKAEQVESLSAAGGTPESVLAGMYITAPLNLVENRLQTLNESVGSSIIPGQDTRKPGQEAPVLPPPPPPPAD